MKKIDCILVTGGHGFIGTQLLPVLPSDLPVVVVDNFLKQVHPNIATNTFPPNVDTYVANILDANLWANLFDKYSPSIIIHLAAETSTGLSGTQMNVHTGTNVQGLAVLLTSLVENSITPKKFVLASSRAVYGEGSWIDSRGSVFSANKRELKDLSKQNWSPRNPLITSDFLVEPSGHDWRTTLKSPTSVYGLTKSFQEDLVEIWAEINQVSLNVLRFQNVYGPGQTPSNSYTGILGLFIRNAMQGLPIEVYEGGDIVRDFVFVTDVVHSIIQSLSKNESVLKADVGTGRRLTLLQVAALVADHYKSPTPIIANKYRVGDVRAAYCNPSAWLDGWAPQISFERGLPETIAYVERFFS